MERVTDLQQSKNRGSICPGPRGSVSSGMRVSIYNENRGSVCSGLRGSIWTEYPSTSNNNFLNLYPNPASQQIKIEFIGELYVDQIVYEVYGSSGELKAIGLMPASKIMNIDLNALANGIYLVRIINSPQQMQKKFIKLN